ncbi:MAG TPA: RidA family protein [Bacteroidales bacterium]|nr:RidA family protein [Bacteroidales bacterium]HOK74444.1 RidA family protein [Bacteroidales bacterium]HOU30080.1 RidA family protein [Bacteroidales bacterium]HPP92005.1 RidA family protein [Bacteroidales bacterium]HQG56234.1 RidA family protein [Bacteroidales bacterium]
MKRIICTSNAPVAAGPYSQAVEAGGILFVSGQVALDPATGKLIEGDIREQTEQVLRNIGAILEAAGYTYRDVVKSTVFLSNIQDFKTMNEVYSKFYPSEQPARVALAVKDLPLGALVEIEAIAIKSK